MKQMNPNGSFTSKQFTGSDSKRRANNLLKRIYSFDLLIYYADVGKFPVEMVS